MNVMKNKEPIPGAAIKMAEQLANRTEEAIVLSGIDDKKSLTANEQRLLAAHNKGKEAVQELIWEGLEEQKKEDNKSKGKKRKVVGED